jgi:AcrR family transcriptional regulator
VRDRVGMATDEDRGQLAETAGSARARGTVPSDAGPSRRRRTDGEVTRARVLKAAVESILERGYYQTSSNEIARRAAVTWGTLQHQFGTREALLLEVANERWAALRDRVATAQVKGETLEARLRSLLDVFASHYAEPDHLAHLQILLDLTRAPDTSEATRQAIAVHGAELVQAWRPLFVQALGEAAADDELVRYAFLVLRGYLTGNLIATSIAESGDHSTQEDLLIRGVAFAIRQRAAEQGLSVE